MHAFVSIHPTLHFKSVCAFNRVYVMAQFFCFLFFGVFCFFFFFKKNKRKPVSQIMWRKFSVGSQKQTVPTP